MAIVVGLLILAWLALVMLGGGAWAHGDASWIMTNPRFKAASGASCCGPSDCRSAGQAKFRKVEGGYSFDTEIDGKAVTLFAPDNVIYENTKDFDVWFCAFPSDIGAGIVRCLFLPGTA
jgi:hypothetical protein